MVCPACFALFGCPVCFALYAGLPDAPLAPDPPLLSRQAEEGENGQLLSLAAPERTSAKPICAPRGGLGGEVAPGREGEPPDVVHRSDSD